MKHLALPLILATLLAACGAKLDGTYSTDGKASGGMLHAKYSFKSNGTVVAEVMGSQVEMKYELEDKKIRLLNPQAPGSAVIFTLRDDGAIQGPAGMTLLKVK